MAQRPDPHVKKCVAQEQNFPEFKIQNLANVPVIASGRVPQQVVYQHAENLVQLHIEIRPPPTGIKIRPFFESKNTAIYRV